MTDKQSRWPDDSLLSLPTNEAEDRPPLSDLARAIASSPSRKVISSDNDRLLIGYVISKSTCGPIEGLFALQEISNAAIGPAWPTHETSTCVGSAKVDLPEGRGVSSGSFAFSLGQRVRKISGASWRGRVVGLYSTDLTPFGYAVESEHELGSVQIYPEAALTAHFDGEST